MACIFKAVLLDLRAGIINSFEGRGAYSRGALIGGFTVDGQRRTLTWLLEAALGAALRSEALESLAAVLVLASVTAVGLDAALVCQHCRRYAISTSTFLATTRKKCSTVLPRFIPPGE